MAAYSTHHTVMSSNYENGIESTDFYISKHFGHLTEILKKSNVMYTQYYQWSSQNACVESLHEMTKA